MNEHSAFTHDLHGSLKPRLRGLVHAWSLIPMTIAAAVLITLSPTGSSRAAVAVYAVAIVGMLAASACYHRLRVTEPTRRWLRRLDHSMIGVAVAGTYTPVIYLLLDGSMRAALLALLWCGAIGSMVVSFVWPHAPQAVRAGVYLALGWAGAAVMPSLFTEGGITAFALVLTGAGFYTAGAIVYAKRAPNPWPNVYGFHEIFHTLVVLAVISHFAAVSVVVHGNA